jgi:hypothetical protein
MPSIEWMKKGPFGVMVHWTVRTMPETGSPEPDWNKRVDSFPVESFVDTLVDLGAKWLIFTCGHCGDAFCAPNPVIERYFPGHCSDRDLIAALGKALHAKGLRLIVYFQTEIDHESEAMREAFGWDLDPADKSIFQQRWTGVMRTYAEQWGTLIDGWWFDSCYDSSAKTFLRTCNSGWNNQRFTGTKWFEAASAGNPDAIVAMNTGVSKDRHTSSFAGDDYLAGESNDMAIRPPEIISDDQPQWHALLWLDCFWLHAEAPGEIDPPRFSDDQLSDYLSECRKGGGGVTFNIGIYADGSLAAATVKQIKRVLQS